MSSFQNCPDTLNAVGVCHVVDIFLCGMVDGTVPMGNAAVGRIVVRADGRTWSDIFVDGNVRKADFRPSAILRRT